VLNKSNIEDPIRIDKIKAKGASGLYLVDDNDSGIFIDNNEIRMGYRDPTFTDIDFLDPAWTEEDPNTRITVTGTKVSWAGLTQNEDAYVYYDYGADYFDGDFRHEFELLHVTGDGDGLIITWGMANLVDDFNGIRDGSGDYLSVYMVDKGATSELRIMEVDGGADHYSGANTVITSDIVYYCTIVRDESVGTHGTLYLYIYSDSARTILVGKQECALHSSKKDFRYLYSVVTYNTTGGIDNSGFLQNLTISTDPFGIEKGIYVYDDGTVDMAMQSGFSATLSAAQDVASGDWYIVQFDTEEDDIQNELNTATYRATIKKSGIFQVSFCLRSAEVLADGNSFYGAIYKNGTLYFSIYGPVHGTTTPTRAGSIRMPLVANDIIDIRTLHNKGEPRQLNTAECRFSMAKIA